MAARSRNYCFTHFEKENQKLKNIEDIECIYCIMGRERCPETGREHTQGFVHFANAVAFKTAQSRLSNYKIHVEIMKGTHDQAIEYCKKEEDYVEHGDRPVQGDRTDLEKIREATNEGRPMHEIIQLASGYQAMRMGELLLRYREEPREIQDIDCEWFWGRQGQITAWHEAISWETRVYQPLSEKWWDGYDGHQVVIIDDPQIIEKSNLNKLTNRFPFRVETKGGSREVKYKRMIFTTESHPATLGIPRNILNRIKIIDCNVNTEVGGNTNPDFFCDCEDLKDDEIPPWFP